MQPFHLEINVLVHFTGTRFPLCDIRSNDPKWPQSEKLRLGYLLLGMFSEETLVQFGHCVCEGPLSENLSPATDLSRFSINDCGDIIAM